MEDKKMNRDMRNLMREFGVSKKLSDWYINNGILPEKLNCTRKHAAMLIVNAYKQQELMRMTGKYYG